MHLSKISIFYLFLIAAFGCGDSLKEKGSTSYLDEIKSWHSKRIENLKKENGWLNLVGLYWLKTGENVFGSDESCDLVFPKGKSPEIIGTFNLKDSVVTFTAKPGIEVTSDGNPVAEKIMMDDTQNNTTVLNSGSLRWFVIKRGDKFGIRLRDLEADLLKEFKDIETFPINDGWNIKSRFEKYDEPKQIAVPNILGMIDEEKTPGVIKFNKDGKEYMLDALDAGDRYFIIFADETSGKETYGGGRFIYVSKEDSAGNINLDFNKAYNPPCVFTKYATCPLPPKQNYLKLRVTAGEKVYGHNH